MPVAFVLLHLALALLAAALPWRIAPARAKRLVVVALVALLPLQLAVARWPALLAATGWADVVFVSELYVPLALLVASAAVRAQPPGRARTRTAGLALVLVVAAARTTSLPLVRPPLVLQARVRDGVVLQTAPSSCAAAAAATLVRALGVDPAATEADLARECLTRPDRGTSDLGLYRGLSRACPGRRVRFARPTLDALRARAAPCLVTVGLEPARVGEPLRSLLRERAGWDEGVAHAVVLLRVDARTVEVGDPRFGRETWPLEHFLALWDGSALLVD